MKRVASLYLPTLSTDRIRRVARALAPPEPRPARHLSIPVDEDPWSCSCPRGGGWRPGARWAQPEGTAAGGVFIDDRLPDKVAVAAAVAGLPPHRRPPSRELGRRSEAAEVPFRAMPPDEVGATLSSLPRIVPGTHGDPHPIVTVHRSGQRVVVAALSPGAAALGVTLGMALTQARLIAPTLDICDHDADADRRLLERLADHAARRWTPVAALSGDDGLWLDLSGAAHLFGGEAQMVAGMLRFLARAGLDARIAVADTPGTAHALARHGRARLTLCPPGGGRAALAGLPVAALRLEDDALATARRLGIERVEALMAMPRGPLARRMGLATLVRIDQALGDVAEAIDPVVPVDAPAVTLKLLEPIATAEAIAQVIDDALAGLMAALAARGLGARTVRLSAERVDADVQRIVVGTARATRDARHLGRLFGLRIERIEPGLGIEAMTLVASWTEPLAAEATDAFAMGTPGALVPLVDRIAGRIGERRLYRLSAVESDVPERSVSRLPPLEPTAGWPPHWPRPARLLSPPEPVDGVLALLPDDPPRRFRWRGRMHELVRGDGPERVHGEWWKSRREIAATRDYYRVEDRDGARFWLFRRGEGDEPAVADRWYLHGLFG